MDLPHVRSLMGKRTTSTELGGALACPHKFSLPSHGTCRFINYRHSNIKHSHAQETQLPRILTFNVKRKNERTKYLRFRICYLGLNP